MTPFLSGRWSNVFVQSWAVPEEHVRPFLLADMRPDRWQGHALVSLVASDLVEPRVFGVRVPGRRRLPQLSLRIHVRDGRRQGVRLLRQFVPRPALATLARAAANEPFVAVPYRRTLEEHELRYGGRTHRIAWTTIGDPHPPPEDGLEWFICNHRWMFGKHWTGAPLSLRVEHPPWRVWRDVRPRLDWDPAVLFGEHWRILEERTPETTFVAEGSPVEVHALAGFLEGQRAATVATAEHASA